MVGYIGLVISVVTLCVAKSAERAAEETGRKVNRQWARITFRQVYDDLQTVRSLAQSLIYVPVEAYCGAALDKLALLKVSDPSALADIAKLNRNIKGIRGICRTLGGAPPEEEAKKMRSRLLKALDASEDIVRARTIGAHATE